MPTHSASPEGSAPLRTCVGCRRREDQELLVRLVLDPDTETRSVTPDPRRRLPGRGAWLHPQVDCLQTAVRRRAFHRAFRGPVDVESLPGLFEQAMLRTAAAPAGGSDAPVLKTDNESGSEI